MKTLIAVGAALVLSNEPDLQPQEPDRIGTTVVCSGGAPRPAGLTPSERMARTEMGTSYVKNHNDPLERKVVVTEWARARTMVCLD